MSLTIKLRERDGVSILDLDGRIVMGREAEQLCSAAKGLLAGGGKKLLVNLAGVRRVDSTGLGALITCHASARAQSARLKLLKPLAHITNLLVITKLITVFEIFDDEAEAVESFVEEMVPSA